MRAQYYIFDHLGSVREMTDSSGTIQARYDYDPYGRATSITSTVPSDFQYAGYYEHASSGLNLTLFRAYDPNTARWLSRDPEGEGSDATLYSYSFNDPVNLTDPLGLTVYIGQRSVLGSPFDHTAIVIIPDNPSDFPFTSLVISAGNSGPRDLSMTTNIFGHLVGEANSPNDTLDSRCKSGTLQNFTVVPTPPGQTDSKFIKNLISAASSYPNNQPYVMFPGLGAGYNSNSFTSGVISAAGGTPPALSGNTPGYSHPLPIP